MTTSASFRHDFYQSDDKLVFSLYCRGIKEDEYHVDTKPDTITVTFKTPDGVEHSLTFYPYGELDTQKTTIQYRQQLKIVVTFTKKLTVCYQYN